MLINGIRYDDGGVAILCYFVAELHNLSLVINQWKMAFITAFVFLTIASAKAIYVR